jgi:alkylation response protein AidB-like acyl-CoA dehydrogenase
VDFGWTDEDRAFRRALEQFLAETLPSSWEELSREGPGSELQAEFSRGFCAALAERGWLLLDSPWQHAIASEVLWAAGEPRGPQYMNVNWIAPAIRKFGSDEQKRYHLDRIARGDVLWCQGFSEPNAGSDLASLTTRAERRGDRYVVNGQKVWTSYCRHAELCFLLVRTSPDEPRHRGLSVLLLPMDLPGVQVREIDAILGDRYFHELFLTDVAVPASCRLGPEGEGWAVAMYGLQFERVGLPRYARAARMLDRLAAQLAAAGRMDDPAVAERLGAARALCEAARILAYRVVDERAHAASPSAHANVARVAGTIADRAVGDLALELLGAEALVYGSPAEANFRASMWAGVATGTTEIQLNLIAERLLGLPRERP